MFFQTTYSVGTVEGVFVLERQWDYKEFMEIQFFTRIFT